MSNDFLRTRVVVITGSSRGIGREIARVFLESGARVVINGRDPASVAETAAGFEKQGFEVLAVHGDVSRIGDCTELVTRTLAAWGRIDILINNAGGGFRGAFDQTPPEVFRKVVESNLMSAAFMTRAAIEEIKKNKGSVVFISSLSGIRGLPLNAPYCVAKMGLTALAQTLRIELAGTGVHIGVAMVGLTDFDEQKRVVAADGSLMQISRNSHHTREQVAKIVLKMVRKRTFVKVLTPLGKVTAVLNRFCPALVEFIVMRSSRSGKYNQ